MFLLLATFQVLVAHHFSNKSAGSTQNKQLRKSSVKHQERTVLNIRKMYLYFASYFKLYIYLSGARQFLWKILRAQHLDSHLLWPKQIECLFFLRLYCTHRLAYAF